MSKEDYYKYVVLDLETTGLDPGFDEILEIGAIVVDSELNEIARYRSIVIPGEHSLALKHMNDFVRDMHTKNGLLADHEASRDETEYYDIGYVEAEFLRFLARWNCKPGEIVLMGKQVGRFDRKFIQQDMPSLEWVLSHRCIELGDVVRFMKEFCGIDVTAETKESNHRAIDDCVSALEEARALRDTIKKMHNAEMVHAIRTGGFAVTPITEEPGTNQLGSFSTVGQSPEDAYQTWLG